MSKPPTISVSKAKSFGIVERPQGNDVPLVRAQKTIQQIETLGARLAWSRAAFCPCQNLNPQTQQPDPLCSKCSGLGFFYFGPRNYVPPADAGTLDSLQKKILEEDGSAVIRGLITRGLTNQTPYDVIGNWVKGSMFLTVRPENRIGYYDRIVNLDAEIVYYEVVEVAENADPTKPLPLRYRATSVNTVQTVDARYEEGSEFEVVDGEIIWGVAALVPGTRVAVHYMTHPTWLVVEHPHVVRETPQAPQSCDTKIPPPGAPTALPIQAVVQLEFLREAPGAQTP